MYPDDKSLDNLQQNIVAYDKELAEIDAQIKECIRN